MIRKEKRKMQKFVAREKMSKKARRELDSSRRVGWGISPVTRRTDSKKRYNRKKKLQLDIEPQLF